MSEKIQPHQLSRQAHVYVRQSTMNPRLPPVCRLSLPRQESGAICLIRASAQASFYRFYIHRVETAAAVGTRGDWPRILDVLPCTNASAEPRALLMQ